MSREVFTDLVSMRHAEEALQYLRAGETCDLLIVDWMLPGMSGIELVRSVRSSDAFSDLPIIMQTAKNRAEHVRKAVSAGATDYVVKPLDCTALVQKITRIVSGP